MKNPRVLFDECLSVNFENHFHFQGQLEKMLFDRDHRIKPRSDHIARIVKEQNSLPVQHAKPNAPSPGQNS